MKILGINYLSESSVALIENGRLKYAISEERINRIKNWWGNPYKSIKFVLKETNNKLNDIDLFATHGSSCYQNIKPNRDIFDNNLKKILSSKLNSNKKKKQIKFLEKDLKMKYQHVRGIKEISNF